MYIHIRMYYIEMASFTRNIYVRTHSFMMSVTATYMYNSKYIDKHAGFQLSLVTRKRWITVLNSL